MEWLLFMNKAKPLYTVEDVLPHLNFIRSKKQEYFVCLSLDSGHRLIRRRVVTIGLLDMALAHPREVFACPLKDRAASVIVAHNHPSGNPQPSQQDAHITQQLVAAGLLLGIEAKDHIIVSSNSHFSFKEHGLM